MEQRYQIRLDEMVADAEVPRGLMRGVLPRLATFLQPFAASLVSPEQRVNARHYVQGLLSDLPSKDAESIAYLHDRERQGLQKFIGQADWDHRPLLAELTRQVGQRLGQDDAVLVFDPSAFPKKGSESVGVQRQWCGRLGKVDNCQVGVFLAYVSGLGHALVDFRLYLPAEWAKDRERRNKAGVPRGVRFRTRHQLALQMLDGRGPLLPHGWVSGDDEMGRSSWFRRQLRSRGERYLLAVPCNTLVRDALAGPPEYSGKGRRPGVPWVRADEWRAALPEGAWQTVDVRDGEKGPVLTQAARAVVQAREGRRVCAEGETLVAFREREGDGGWKYDYALSNALAVGVEELARVFKAEHRVEECLQRAKSEAGLADYQVRTWEGWHHHQALSLLAAWFLAEEARRGKNPDAGVDRAAGPGDDRADPDRGSGLPPARADTPLRQPPPAAQRGGAAVPLAQPQPLATSAL